MARPRITPFAYRARRGIVRLEQIASQVVFGPDEDGTASATWSFELEFS